MATVFRYLTTVRIKNLRRYEILVYNNSGALAKFCLIQSEVLFEQRTLVSFVPASSVPDFCTPWRHYTPDALFVKCPSFMTDFNQDGCREILLNHTGFRLHENLLQMYVCMFVQFVNYTHQAACKPFTGEQFRLGSKAGDTLSSRDVRTVCPRPKIQPSS
jgi:hypothetical protein